MTNRRTTTKSLGEDPGRPLRRWVTRLVLILLFACSPALGAPHRWWAGGGVGVSFGGNVDYLSVEPEIGYWVTEKFTVGARLVLRYRNDNRYADGISTTDYGGAAFGRYFLIEHVFLQGEYEYLNYEYSPPAQESFREGFGSWFGGAGFAQPIGKDASFFILGLYNFTYEDNQPAPYSGPWVVRMGVGFRF